MPSKPEPPWKRAYLTSGQNSAAPNCPVCGRLNDGFTHIGEKPDRTPPAAGDASLCGYCGALAVFEAGGGLRLPTVEETAEMLSDPRIKLLLSGLPYLPPPESR